jgi:hypothetical protein
VGSWGLEGGWLGREGGGWEGGGGALTKSVDARWPQPIPPLETVLHGNVCWRKRWYTPLKKNGPSRHARGCGGDGGGGGSGGGGCMQGCLSCQSGVVQHHAVTASETAWMVRTSCMMVNESGTRLTWVVVVGSVEPGVEAREVWTAVGCAKCRQMTDKQRDNAHRL